MILWATVLLRQLPPSLISLLQRLSPRSRRMTRPGTSRVAVVAGAGARRLPGQEPHGGLVHLRMMAHLPMQSRWSFRTPRARSPVISPISDPSRRPMPLPSPLPQQTAVSSPTPRTASTSRPQARPRTRRRKTRMRAPSTLPAPATTRYTVSLAPKRAAPLAA